MKLDFLASTLTAFALVSAAAAGCASTPRERDSAMNATTTFSPSSQIEPATLVLRSYEAALNRADVDAIVSLYTPDAVFMAQHRSPAIGRAAIEATYREIFAMIRLDITFEIDEVVVVSPTVAYARTRSAGTTTILAADVQVSEGNQELFVLTRDDERSDWQISRYIFSTTQPPQG
ncbi:MAG: SgcJ/EcaC family oxidoreductase [Deltaproteobacteria bacterium]|nr:SgcJ/EcaC family oxidoreductase [Deltaproteobacteria bacterium]